jgi:hypothetical protein
VLKNIQLISQEVSMPKAVDSPAPATTFDEWLALYETAIVSQSFPRRRKAEIPEAQLSLF